MNNPDRFRRAEDDYFRLKGQFATGRITHQQFEQALQALMIEDDQGRHWSLGVDTGKWYRHDGQAWVETDPYTGAVGQSPSGPPRPPTLPERGGQRGASYPPSPLPPPAFSAPYAPPQRAAKSGGGCGGCIIPGCLAVIVLIVLLGIGGFVAYSSGALTLNTVLNLVGLGPGDIEVDNFRDDAIQVNVRRIDPTQATPSSGSTFNLNAFDVKSYRATNPGTYRVEFRTARGSAILGACNLNIRSGDRYQFVALPERLVVNRANNPSNVGRDFVVQTSALCK